HLHIFSLCTGTPSTEISALSLHDALPILLDRPRRAADLAGAAGARRWLRDRPRQRAPVAAPRLPQPRTDQHRRHLRGAPDGRHRRRQRRGARVRVRALAPHRDRRTARAIGVGAGRGEGRPASLARPAGGRRARGEHVGVPPLRALHRRRRRRVRAAQRRRAHRPRGLSPGGRPPPVIAMGGRRRTRGMAELERDLARDREASDLPGAGEAPLRELEARLAAQEQRLATLVRRAAERTDLLLRFTVATGLATSEEEVAQVFARELSSLVRAETGAVMRLSADGRSLVRLAGSGGAPAVAEAPAVPLDAPLP